MEYRFLGATGIRVSRLCFGSLTLSPSHGAVDRRRAAALLRFALEQGINFIDTAESYQNYECLRIALAGRSDEAVIASKSYAYTRKDMERSLTGALRALDRSYLDLFLLHEQETALTIRGHYEALAYLLEAKEKGLVRAVGISTHAVAAVRAAAAMAEIDVIHPLLNRHGLGIIDGDCEAMLAAVAEARAAGKGIYVMKALGGGHLAGEAAEALRFVFGLPFVDAVAVGMASRAEVKANVLLADGRPLPPRLAQAVRARPRRLLVEEWCTGCGACVASCHQGALVVVDGRVQVRAARCILCGYCARACRDFCLKVV